MGNDTFQGWLDNTLIKQYWITLWPIDPLPMTLSMTAHMALVMSIAVALVINIAVALVISKAATNTISTVSKAAQ